MTEFISDKDPEVLKTKLNDLGPSIQILSIYSINQVHFAWFKPEQKKKKEKDHEK